MATVNIGLKLKNAIFFFVNNIIVGKDWGTYILDTGDRDMIITILRGIQDDKIESDISVDVLLGYLGGGGTGEGGTGSVGPQGPMGPAGPKGDKGDTGARGASGLQGSVGPQGPQGPAGKDGSQGLQGIQGIQGLDGAKGAKGDAGAQGPQGLKGADGAKGADGIQGIQGPAGIQGVKGDAGAQGIQGLKGDTGATGLQGVAGKDGEKGDPGIQGIPGTQGPAGVDGKEGPAGPAGLQGVQGEQGPKGEDGAQGPQGPMGPAGGGLKISTIVESIAMLDTLTGFEEGDAVLINTGNVEYEDNAKLFILKDGVWSFLVDLSGAEGIQGPTGPQGLQGEKGDTGLQGIAGTQGEQGVAGATGPAGKDGADGAVGPEGPQGPQGLQGLQGLQGPEGPEGIRGAQGEDGANGLPGDSALDLYRAENGNPELTFQDMLNRLRGEPGAEGPEGPAGLDGADGAPGLEGRDGASAYDLWQSAGNVGTMEEFLASLKGEKGDSGIVTGNIDLSSILSSETKDMIYYNAAAQKLLDGSLLEEDLQAYRDSVQNMSGITGLYLASSTIASMFSDLGVDMFADPGRQFTLTDVTNWVRQYSQNNWRADILYMLDLEERPVLDFPIDGTILRRISKARRFEVSREESILNFYSYAHAVAPTDEQIPTGLTFNAGERYIYRCSSTDSDGYPAVRFGMSLYNKDTNLQITTLVFNEYNLPDPEKYKRMYFDKSVYTVSYRNADNKFCLGVVDATTHERIGHLTSDVTLEDNVFYYLKPYSSGSWYEAVNIYRLYDLDGVVQYGEPLPQFFPTSGYKEIVSMVKMDGANTPITPGDSVAEPVRIGDTVSTAISGLDLINNSYRMSMGSPYAPGTSKLVFSIMDGADVNLGSVELTPYNTYIPGYENYVLFTGFEDWLFYTKDNKIYFSLVNNREPGDSASELMRNVLVEDAAAAGTSLRIVMTPTPSIYNPDLNKYTS